MADNLPPATRFPTCPGGGSILDFYGGQFESVYILLHPFIRPTGIGIERFTPSRWPDKTEMLEGCDAVSWHQVRELVGFGTLADIDIALRTSIGGLSPEHADPARASRLLRACASAAVVPPPEGDVPQLLENRIYGALERLGHERVWVCDEWGVERRLRGLDELARGEYIPLHGSLFAPEHDLLITTHWDSHGSFVCSSRDVIERLLAFDPFEGFFCTQATQVYWGPASS